MDIAKQTAASDVLVNDVALRKPEFDPKWLITNFFTAVKVKGKALSAFNHLSTTPRSRLWK
jgi:hypothetical protein